MRFASHHITSEKLLNEQQTSGHLLETKDGLLCTRC